MRPMNGRKVGLCALTLLCPKFGLAFSYYSFWLLHGLHLLLHIFYPRLHSNSNFSCMSLLHEQKWCNDIHFSNNLDELLFCPSIVYTLQPILILQTLLNIKHINNIHVQPSSILSTVFYLLRKFCRHKKYSFQPSCFL